PHGRMDRGGASHVSERVLRVGLLGCGNVGAAVIRLLHDRTDDIALRADCRLRVTRIAVRNPGRTRDVPTDPPVFTPDSLALGYAEADPTADVEGFDAAAKCAILASIAFNSRVVAGDVFREGITRVQPQDIADATRLGYVVKLLAIAELEDGEVSARVHPAMIPASHPLASVRDAFNAVFLEGPSIGQLMFYGRGAGGEPTATAVVGDLVSVARNLATGGRGIGCTCALERRIRPMDDTRGQYYLNLHVEDRPGVLADIADQFGRNGV